MAKSRYGGQHEKALDPVLLLVCDAYWNQVHRHYFVKLPDEGAKAIAAKLTQWSRKRLPSGALVPLVERLQRQGLVLAQVLIDTANHSEYVSRVQPTQIGLERAETLRPPSKKR